MSNTIDLVRQVVDDLSASGFRVAVFGGWAEELLAIAEPREHMDIDLLVFDANEAELDRFLAGRSEIREKRLPHKRAFLASDVMVEMLLVHGGHTNFWGTVSYAWPQAESGDVDGLPVASAEHLVGYRRDYVAIRSRRRA